MEIRSTSSGNLQLGSALWTARGLDGYAGKAKRAVLIDRFCRLRRMQTINRTNQEEYHKGYEDKIDQGVNEKTIIQCWSASCLSIGKAGVGASIQGDEQIAKINITQYQPDRGHDDVIDQRCNDLPKSRADDNAHGQVDDITPHGELTEFLEQIFLLKKMIPTLETERYGIAISLFRQTECQPKIRQDFFIP